MVQGMRRVVCLFMLIWRDVSRVCLEDMSGSTMMNRVTLMQSFAHETYHHCWTVICFGMLRRLCLVNQGV